MDPQTVYTRLVTECPLARMLPAMDIHQLMTMELPEWFTDLFGSVYGRETDSVTKPIQYRTFVLRAQSQQIMKAWDPANDEAVVFSAPKAPIKYCGHVFVNAAFRDLGSTARPSKCPCRNVFSRGDCDAYQALVARYSPDKDLAHVYGEEAQTVFFEDVQAFFSKRSKRSRQ